jgi:hypothetical protein
MGGLEAAKTVPAPSREVGRRALAAMLEHRSILAGLSVFHEHWGISSVSRSARSDR